MNNEIKGGQMNALRRETNVHLGLSLHLYFHHKNDKKKQPFYTTDNYSRYLEKILLQICTQILPIKNLQRKNFFMVFFRVSHRKYT